MSDKNLTNVDIVMNYWHFRNERQTQDLASVEGEKQSDVTEATCSSSQWSTLTRPEATGPHRNTQVPSEHLETFFLL